MPFTIRVQAIKPGALQVKEVQKEIDRALKAQGRVLVKELHSTIETWATARPTMDFETGRNQREAWVWGGPKGTGMGVTKWRRLDEGTRGGYVIAARRKPMLWYQSKFSPKTRPRWLGSRPGGKKGPYDVRRKSVVHPGVEARRWSETLGNKERGPFTTRIQQAVNRGFKFKKP